MKRTLIKVILFVLLAALLALTVCAAQAYVAHTHKWTLVATRKAPTCTQAGTGIYSCSCGTRKTDTIPAAGHKWGGWQTTKAATCTAAGTKTRTCSVCGEKQTQSIPATGKHSTEKKIYITGEPQELKWEYNPDGYSGTMSCNAVNETGTDERLSFSWWIKSGDSWKLLHQYEKTLTVTKPGWHRCEVYDTRTGESKYTRDAVAKVKLEFVRSKKLGKHNYEFKFRGGFAPYQLVGSEQKKVCL